MPEPSIVAHLRRINQFSVVSLHRHRWRDFGGEIQLGNIGGWRFAGGSMRSLFKAGFLAAFAAILLLGKLSISAAQQGDEATALNKKVIELYNAGRYADAIPIAQQVLAIREKALGRDHPDVAQSLNNLAALYESEGRYAETEPLYQRSLAIREKALGREHPNVANTLINL